MHLKFLRGGGLKGDILFASSTFYAFTPKELKRYLRQARNNCFSQIILNEPGWAGYIQYNNALVISRHIEQSVWYHNYCGYLREAGYDIRDFNFFHYKHPFSSRPDIFVSLIRAAL